MKYNLFSLSFLFILLLNTSCQDRQSTVSITPGQLSSWVNYLSSDEMKGRANGSGEMKDAALWLAGKFSEFGLQPSGEQKSFIHDYTFTTRSGLNVDERNVVGIMPGSDPDLAGQYIIISAHFDHIGIRTAVQGDSIYNGADDNAAGTSTLLGVARNLSLSGKKPGRSIIFTAVSGEEMGLRGSRNIASNMPVPVEDVYANINFEMTGHSEEFGKGRYYMTGCSYSNLDEVLSGFITDDNFVLLDSIDGADRLFFMSDNAAFSMLQRDDSLIYGIPSGTFATTTHGDHIHRPHDEAGLFDFENMAGLVNHFTHLILELSYTDKNVEWTDDRFKRLK